MIEAQNLTRRYGDFAAVSDVSFSIESGEVVGLLGHNGAGKTTIMKMLTGYLQPSAGYARVDGVDVQTHPKQAQANIGYLPENLPLYPEMTVAQFLTYTARLRGCDPRASVTWAIERTQLTSKATHRIDTLSRGYKQRVGVAQAILHKPRFLILDEPSNGLDPNQIQQMRQLIRDLAQDATVILSTHIMQEVNAVCDRTLILSNGALVLDAQLHDLQQTHELYLRCGPGLSTSLIESVGGVISLSSLAPGEWVITVAQEIAAAQEIDQVAAAIAVVLAEANQPLFELRPQTKDLERVFAQVNENAQQLAQEVA